MPEKTTDETGTRHKILARIGFLVIVLGFLCFISAISFTLVHAGFKPSQIRSSSNSSDFLTDTQLWLLNAGTGLLGGILLRYDRPIICGITGLITNLSITGATLLYLSWRSSIISVEIIIPLILGIIPGVMVYNFLDGVFKKK